MNKRIDEKAVEKAVELLGESIPQNIRRQLHQAWFEGLINSSYEHLDRLKIPQDNTEVKVVSAFALDDEQRRRLKDKLQEKLGFEITITEEVNPALNCRACGQHRFPVP